MRSLSRWCVVFTLFLLAPIVVLVALGAQGTAARRITTTPLKDARVASPGGVLEWRGQTLVSDAEAGSIRRFAANGPAPDLVSPGGIAAPGALVPWANGAVLVYSRGDQRFVVVDEKGAVSAAPSSLAIPDGPARLSVSNDLYRATTDGSLVWSALERGADTALLRRDATGRLTTVTRLRNAATRSVRQGAIGMTMSVPYAPVDDWAISATGDVVIVRGDPYRVDRVSPAGAIVEGPVRVYDKVPVTKQDKEAHARQMEESRNQPRLNLSGLPAMTMPDEAYPAVKAAFARGSVHVAPDGSAWVRRLTAHDATVSLFDVFDATGAFREQVALSQGVTLLGFGATVGYLSKPSGSGAVTIETFVWR